jgi:hypothetical protein
LFGIALTEEEPIDFLGWFFERKSAVKSLGGIGGVEKEGLRSYDGAEGLLFHGIAQVVKRR